MRSFVIALALAAACSSTAAALRIVCTTTIVGDVVSQIAGEGDDVAVLLPADADPHAFEPTPRDLVAVADADVVFLNGAGLEAGIERIFEIASGRVVSLSDGLDLLHFDSAHGDEDHGDADPHVWFDPAHVASWVETIASTLIDLEPHREPEYRGRADAYLSELEALDAWIEERLDTLPPERRKLVTDHAAFAYFAARYGFEQVGTVFPGLSSLAAPSAKDLAALEQSILAVGVPALFVGTTVNRSLAEQIAADTGTKIVSLYTGSLSPLGGPADTYLRLMRYDVEAIIEGLSEAL